MKETINRIFTKGEYVYIVDYWCTEDGPQACETKAKILKVDKKAQTFTALLYGDTYQIYSFNDYGRLFFDTLDETTIATNNLPKPNTIVYQVIRNKVYKKLVKGIGGKHINGVFDLIIHFAKGKDVSSKEIGNSIFLCEPEAQMKSDYKK